MRKLSIDEKRTSELIDELITASIKCYMAQEVGPSRNLELAQQMNKKRNMLVRAIDKRLDETYTSPEEKTY